MKLIFGRNDRFVAITKRGFLELPPRILSFFFSGFAFPKRLMPNDDDDVHRLMDYERLICWIRTPQEKSSEREKLVPNLNDLFFIPAAVAPTTWCRPVWETVDRGLSLGWMWHWNVKLVCHYHISGPASSRQWMFADFFFRRGRRRCRVSSIKSHLSNHSRSVMSIKTDLDSLTDTRRRRPRCPAWRFFVWVG